MVFKWLLQLDHLSFAFLGVSAAHLSDCVGVHFHSQNWFSLLVDSEVSLAQCIVLFVGYAPHHNDLKYFIPSRLRQQIVEPFACVQLLNCSVELADFN